MLFSLHDHLVQSFTKNSNAATWLTLLQTPSWPNTLWGPLCQQSLECLPHFLQTNFVQLTTQT